MARFIRNVSAPSLKVARLSTQRLWCRDASIPEHAASRSLRWCLEPFKHLACQPAAPQLLAFRIGLMGQKLPVEFAWAARRLGHRGAQNGPKLMADVLPGKESASRIPDTRRRGLNDCSSAPPGYPVDRSCALNTGGSIARSFPRANTDRWSGRADSNRGPLAPEASDTWDRGVPPSNLHPSQHVRVAAHSGPMQFHRVPLETAPSRYPRAPPRVPTAFSEAPRAGGQPRAVREG